jgi:hypothetical protein
MFRSAADIMLGVFVAFVVVPIVLVESVRLFLNILDRRRRLPPHTLRRIH